VKNLTCSSFVEDWSNLAVQLYIDPTALLKGEVVGGVRINPRPVQMEKQTITRGNQQWGRVIQSYKSKGNFDAVLEKANISQEDMKFIVDEVAAGNV